MKYIISEDRKEDIIKQYIMSTFDRVDDVLFGKRHTYYGSGLVNGKDRGEQTIIIVLINNLDDELSKQDLQELKQKILQLCKHEVGFVNLLQNSSNVPI